MTIFSIFVINRAGSLIFHYDHNTQRFAIEKTFSFPLRFRLKEFDSRIMVDFGQSDGIKVGHMILSINGTKLDGEKMADGTKVLDFLNTEANYPVSIEFGSPLLTTNKKIVLAGLFHGLYAVSVQLSPAERSSGIQCLEAHGFKLHCRQSMTGVKFVVMTDPRQGGVELLLKRLYELYADFALKNPFYALDMPIRCSLFDGSVQSAVELTERTGFPTTER